MHEKGIDDYSEDDVSVLVVWVPMLQIAGLSLSDSVSLAVGAHLLVLAYVFGFAILLIALRARVITPVGEKVEV